MSSRNNSARNLTAATERRWPARSSFGHSPRQISSQSLLHTFPYTVYFRASDEFVIVLRSSTPEEIPRSGGGGARYIRNREHAFFLGGAASQPRDNIREPRPRVVLANVGASRKPSTGSQSPRARTLKGFVMRLLGLVIGALIILASAISFAAPDLRLSLERSVITPAGLSRSPP